MRFRLLGALAVVLTVVGVLVVVRAGERSPVEPQRSRLMPATVGARIELGGHPVAVAIGAGAIWVVDATRETLTKVDPRTRAVAGVRRHVAGGPFAVAVGAGAVWVAAGDGTVRAYDPRTVRPSGPTATVRGANGLAVGEGGVWVTSRRAGTVTRIDPRTRRAGAPIAVGRGPADIAVGLGGVWVGNADGGSISRIDPRGGRADTPIAVGARQVLALAVGEGGVWVARGGGPDGDRTQLVQIDAATRKIIAGPIRVPGAAALDLVAGDGVWVTDSGSPLSTQPDGRGGVTRVDPATGRMAGRQLRTGRRPSAIALGAGGAWVTNEDDGTLTTITVDKRRGS